jgi:hypothetical protein
MYSGGRVARTLIERSRIHTARPRVRNGDFPRGIRDGWWKVTALEKRFVETQIKHVLKTVVDVNTPVNLFFESVSGLGQYPRKRNKNLNLTGNPPSIRGHTCGNCQRKFLAARSTSRTSSTLRSAMSADPSSTTLERSQRLCQKRKSLSGPEREK